MFHLSSSVNLATKEVEEEGMLHPSYDRQQLMQRALLRIIASSSRHKIRLNVGHLLRTCARFGIAIQIQPTTSG
jgi:hypothetical protein